MFVYQFMSEVVDIIAGNEDEEFDPHKNRVLERPTTYSETMIHMLKGALGIGVLAMPDAIRHLGLVQGTIGITLIGLITIYSLHILIGAQYYLCKINKRGYMSYPKCMSRAIKAGPAWIHRTAFFFYVMADATLVTTQLGFCTIYVVFAAINVKQVTDYYGLHFETRMWIIFLFPAQVIINMIKDLKLLTLLSTFSNFVLFLAFILVFFYLTEEDVVVVDEMFSLKSITEIPVFIGLVLFALEAVGLILALEYNMEHPEHFTGFCGLLTIGMLITIMLFLVMGITGYVKYGDNVRTAITLNLPQQDKKAQAAKLTYAFAVYLTYPLQNFVAWRTLWRRMQKNIKMDSPMFWNYMLRVALVIVPFAVALALPSLGGFMSLFGSLSLSLVAFIFPGLMDTCIWYPDRYGFGHYKLFRGFILMFIGLVFLVSGVYTSILRIMKTI